jgi:hypothetical protein
LVSAVGGILGKTISPITGIYSALTDAFNGVSALRTDVQNMMNDWQSKNTGAFTGAILNTIVDSFNAAWTLGGIATMLGLITMLGSQIIGSFLTGGLYTFINENSAIIILLAQFSALFYSLWLQYPHTSGGGRRK